MYIEYIFYHAHEISWDNNPFLHQVTLPVYLNSTRAELLFTLDFKAKGMSESGDHHYYERGVALLSSGL
jgi:dynein heavy chain 1